MNRQQLILILIALAILGGAGLVLLKRNRDSWSVPEAKMGDKVLTYFEPNDVAAIHIVGASELNLVRKDNVWRVQERHDYPANFGLISDVLIRLRDLKVVEADTVGQPDLSRVDLDEPGKSANSGTRVEFKDTQGKVIETLRLGRKHMHESAVPTGLGGPTPDGRYILLESNPSEVFLISDALVSLQPNPQSWLNKDFFKADNVKSIALMSTNTADSWKVSRESETSPWILADAKPGETLDTNRIHQAVKTLNFCAFVDIRPTADPAQNGLEHPMVLTAETFDHFAYTLKIGPKSAESVCCVAVAVSAEIPSERVAGKDESADDRKKLDQEFQDRTKKLKEKLAKEQSLAPWVYVVNSWIMDPLIWDRARILEVKREETSVDSTRGATPFAPAIGSPFTIRQ